MSILASIRGRMQPEPLLTTEDLEDAARAKPVDTRDDLAKFGDTMDKLLDQRLKRREQIASDIADLESRIADLVEQDRQNTVIIEMAERCVREARDHAEPVGIFPVKQPQPEKVVIDPLQKRMAERSRDEHESARHEPEQEPETA